MSKMAEMDQTIKELRDAAAAINSAADWLYQQFSGTGEEPAPQPEETQAEPEPKKELKLEDVRKVLAERSRAGYTAQIRELLHKYGASKLSAVDPCVLSSWSSPEWRVDSVRKSGGFWSN